MKNCFPMRAPTVDGSWYTFTMEDEPVTLNESVMVLLGKPGTPLLYKDIMRGDPESGLFEGDVIYSDGVEYLVCYDCGFYAIAEDYRVRYLYTFTNYKVLGIAEYGIKFPLPYMRARRYVFTDKVKTFNLWHVASAVDGELILWTVKDTVKISELHQFAWYRRDGVEIFLGCEYDGHIIELRGGRLTYKSDEGYIDLKTGGALVGYNPGSTD